MSEEGWAGNSASEILADFNRVLSSLPKPEPLEMVIPFNALAFMRREDEDRLDRAFARKEPWSLGLMMAKISHKASEDMFAFSRGPRL